jgi:hypothetical protein
VIIADVIDAVIAVLICKFLARAVRVIVTFIYRKRTVAGVGTEAHPGTVRRGGVFAFAACAGDVFAHFIRIVIAAVIGFLAAAET